MDAALKPRKQPSQTRSRQLVDTILEATARVLARHGYARTNTNLIAERAGVSVGSIYQYFPNKDALIVAVHERHVAQMGQVVDTILAGSRSATLHEHVTALVRAMLAAHLSEPEWHRVVERELPHLDPPYQDSEPAQYGVRRIRDLLESHRDEVRCRNLDSAAWWVIQIIKSLVHAAVLEPPPHLTLSEIEPAVVDAVIGYLGGGASA